LENANDSEVRRLERERFVDMEKHLSALMTERWSQDRKIAELNDALALQTTLCDQAESRAADAIKRAEIVDESHNRTMETHHELQDRVDTLEVQLQDHVDRLLAQTSLLDQREADGVTLRAQVDELLHSRDQHVRALDQARTALQAASSRAEEVDAQYHRAREQIGTLEADIAELRGEIETRTADADSVRARLTDVENSWSKSREEADAFRAFTTGSLGELLDSHRDLKADEDRSTRGHAEKIQAVEAEVQSLRLMLREAGQRLEESQTKLGEERQRVREREGDHSSLHAQIIALRSQLSNVLADTGKLRKDVVDKECTIIEKHKEATDATIKLSMLRNYLAENGINVDEGDMRSSSRAGRGSPAAIAELESKLAERTRLLDAAENELAQAIRRRRDAETQAAQFSSQLDQLRSTQNRSRSGDADAEARAAEAERKLDETERGYKTRMQQMEEDYQLAVHYVK
jgi:chromosome segregation ATPase